MAMEKEITIWSYKLPALIVIGAGFLLMVPAFWEGFSEFIHRLENQEEYSLGYMIPLVSAYLVWQRRELLSRIDFKPSIANEYWMKWYLLTDSLTLNRTDGSLVRLTAPIMANEKETDAENRLNEFLLTVNPMLDDYVPIKINAIIIRSV
jgi:hypothetical protein